MNISVKKISDITGLNYNKKLKLFYGSFKGYNFFIKPDITAKVYHIFLTVKIKINSVKYVYDFDSDFSKKDISIEDYNIQNIPDNDMSDCLLDEKIKILRVLCTVLDKIEFSNNTISAVIYMNDENFVLSLYAALCELVDFCNDNNLISCCINCGKTQNISQYSINNYYVNSCDNCYNNVYFNMKSFLKPDYIENESIISGILGSLIGSLILALLIFIFNISIKNTTAINLISVMCIFPYLISMKLYHILSSNYFTYKCIFISFFICLCIIPISIIYSAGYSVSHNIKDNFNIYLGKYEQSLQEYTEESYDSIIAEFGSTENYIDIQTKKYKEYLIKNTKINAGIKLVINSIKEDPQTKNIIYKKILLTIIWLSVGLLCTIFYKKNIYDKNNCTIALH